MRGSPRRRKTIQSRIVSRGLPRTGARACSRSLPTPAGVAQEAEAMGDYAQQQPASQSASTPVTAKLIAPQASRDAFPTPQQVASPEGPMSLHGLSREAIDRLIKEMITQAHDVLKTALDA